MEFMASKNVKYFLDKIFFIYLVAFPFGQLFKLYLPLNSHFVPLLLVDVLTVFFIPFFISSLKQIGKISKAFLYFILTGLFSLVLYSHFDVEAITAPSLYLLRLLGILSLYFYVSGRFVKPQQKEILIKALSLVGVVTAVSAWFGYFAFPDFKAFEVWGWDDHLYRLIGTFLDPGFTGIILVFGFLSAYFVYLSKKDKIYFYFAAFIFISILFTYSRSSYLALIFSFPVLLRRSKTGFKKTLALFCIIFAVGIYLLPRPYGEGVKLTRVSSIEARLLNYRQTFEIFKSSPVFGVGYNNICNVRVVLHRDDPSSHSCKGADSSILFLLATTGIVGFTFFVYFVRRVLKKAHGHHAKPLLISSLVALFVHSLFVNSLVYPWVMGWVAILIPSDLTQENAPLA